jgi:hypothetical protein
MKDELDVHAMLSSFHVQMLFVPSGEVTSSDQPLRL